MKLRRYEIRKLILEEMRSILDKDYKVNLQISDDLDRCVDNESLIHDFCQFCASHLKISEIPSVKIVSDREKSGIRTTADYNPGNHKIRIYGKNRAIVDICRSIAHEMTHMEQMLGGRIKFPVQDAGVIIEDEANSKAGEIIKLFAKSGGNRSAIYESKRYKI